MSTIVPNCIITYPKDLSRFDLKIDALTFPVDISGLQSITLTVLLDGLPTSYSSVDITNIVEALTGTVDSSIGANGILGIGTSFTTETLVNDTIITELGDKFEVEAISNDTEIITKSSPMIDRSDVTAYRLSNYITIPASAINGVTILTDGNYSFVFNYEFTTEIITNSASPFTKYVFANQYNCVEAKLMNLALYCSEDCVDMNTLKYTLLLKALLDSMEVILSEDVVDTTALGIVKGKIDRYCLLLNNNCTSC